MARLNREKRRKSNMRKAISDARKSVRARMNRIDNNSDKINSTDKENEKKKIEIKSF